MKKVIVAICLIIGFTAITCSANPRNEYWLPELSEYIESDRLLVELVRITGCLDIIVTDAEYFIPTNPAAIMAQSDWLTAYEYIPERRDCDDFVRMFRGWMSECGFGNVLTMSLGIVYYDADGVGHGHAVIGFLVNGELVIGEPQTGKIVTYDKYQVMFIVI